MCHNEVRSLLQRHHCGGKGSEPAEEERNLPDFHLYLPMVHLRRWFNGGKSRVSRTKSDETNWGKVTSNVSTSYGIWTWKGDGVPSEKLVMGMAAYGRTWELKDPRQYEIGAPAVGIGQQGSLGVMSYSAIVEFNGEKNATVVFDNATVSTYSYAGRDWIGYDDTTSVEYKVKFAKDQRLEGYFFFGLLDLTATGILLE